MPIDSDRSQTRPLRIRVARQAALVALFLITALLGTLTGVLFAFSGDLPEITALDDYEPGTITRLLAGDGRVIGEFATEHRVVIGYDEMAPVLRQAIVATEDGDFESHFGLDPVRIVAAVVRGMLPNRPMTGASTITQQAARLLFLQDEYMASGIFARDGIRGLERKAKEWLLALQLEKRFTKREIFAFYANQTNLGPGIYGVEAAARTYFNKSARELTLPEAASIAAIFQTPARLNPFANPDQNLARRNTVVLPRMVAEGFITRDEGDNAAAEPLVVSGQSVPASSLAPYFAEDIRQALERRYGADAIYRAGLQVQTTLDAELQAAANIAVDRGLRRIDKRRNRFAPPTRNILAEGHQLDTFTTGRWATPFRRGDIVPAVVTSVSERTPTGAARIRIAHREIELLPSAFAWTRRRSAADLFQRGDLIEVEVREIGDDGPTRVALEQPPALEAALVALDNRTGQIRAMVGGFSFARCTRACSRSRCRS